MKSLSEKKKFWDVIKTVGELVSKCSVACGLGGGGLALWTGAAKAAVTLAVCIGAGVPVVIGGAAFIAGAIMVSKLEKEIERMTPRLSADALKKLINKEPDAPAPSLAATPDLGKEFTDGVDNKVQPMKALRFKNPAPDNRTPNS